MTHEKVIARFWSKVQKGPDCWLWSGGRQTDGYGMFYHKGGRTAAHRFALVVAGTAIPRGMVVDHQCRNRACVRPAHLRVVTPRTNALENSVGLTAVNAQKTHCIRGHLLAGANITRRSGKTRECRVCLYTIHLPKYRKRKRHGNPL